MIRSHGLKFNSVIHVRQFLTCNHGNDDFEYSNDGLKKSYAFQRLKYVTSQMKETRHLAFEVQFSQL